MAGGRKKGKKSEKQRETGVGSLESGVGSLAIGDQPSTSSAPPQVQPAPPPVQVAPPPAQAAPPPAQAVPPPTDSKAEEKEDDDDVGLGLGGPKRRRPRKKKAAAAEAAAAHTPQDATPKPAAPAPAAGFPMQTASAPVGLISAPPGWGQRPTIQPPLGFAPPVAAPPVAASRPAPIPQPVPIPAQTPSTSSARSQASSGSVGGDQAKHAAQPTTQYSKTAICRFKIPARIEGRSVPFISKTVLTNYLPMTIQAKKIYRYDVAFTPDKPKKYLTKAFNLSKEKNFPRSLVAFDQRKNCYSLDPLPKVTDTTRLLTTVEFADANGKNMKFEVTYKATGIVDLGTILSYMQTKGTSLNPPTEAIQCIDVILRQGTLENYVKSGRQFFKRPANPIPLGEGLEIWTGMFQSAIFTSRAFINIDVAHKGFPVQQPLIETMIKEFKIDVNRPLEQQRSRSIESFHSFIKGLRVVAKIGGDTSSKGMKREFICNEVAAPANKLFFPMTDAAGVQKRMSVAEYFNNVKRVRLRYPDLNCMWVGPRDKNIFYPIELLDVSYGQVMNKQLNEFQLRNMVRTAATPPDERKRKIEEVIRDMNYTRNPFFKKFGMEIDDKFYTVQAKVLKPPTLAVGGGQPVEPRRGAWQANQLLVPETLDAWGFVALDLDVRGSNAEYIINMLGNVGSKMGMRVVPPLQRYFNIRITDLHKVFADAVDKKIKFMVIVVSGRGRDYYHKVKQLAETRFGIVTQCIREDTATKRMGDQTIRNILLKVNSKLNGVNQALASIPRCLAGGGVMVVGADVTHPSPDQTSLPSIAAVTASIDKRCFVYNIQLSVQTPKKEMIVEFEDMMVEHLKVYQSHQKALPKKIYVFRDGVSEGQFAEVMNSELQAVHDAYRRLAGPNAKPEVLFLLVQKRHHTRLFVPNSRDNVDPGTVVDTDIVHASELDFYLVSHAAIKGTARPTRYHAVCNDGCIPYDEVEQLTYYLCHLYSRCMRAVSYPTPTYYAHLACLRARSLTYGMTFNNEDLDRKPQRLNVMDKILQTSRMFFV